MAMCYYEKIIDEKKDLEPLIQSKTKFEYIVKNYPNTDFALDSKFKINLINDVLASKEMYIGIYYLKNEKWIAAINRFKNLSQIMRQLFMLRKHYIDLSKQIIKLAS